jgi:hypothetical protein
VGEDPAKVVTLAAGRSRAVLPAMTLVWWALVGCATSPASPPTPPASSTRPPVAKPAAVPATDAPASSRGPDATTRTVPDAEVAERVEPGGACGDLGCLLFDSAEAAFQHVVSTEDPAILAVGEAHARRGTEGIPSATERFGAKLLPQLRGRATDLIVELMLPPSGCRAPAEQVKKKQAPVTQGQAEGTQNEYVALGHRARALGIAADALRPSCDDLEAIRDAGEDAVLAMLRAIQRLSEAALLERYRANETRGHDGIVLGYGGAMHNDVTPRPGREAFSFGPSLAEQTGGRYVAIDLIVPEFIQDTEVWRELPWHGSFDPEKHPRRATLFAHRDGSYTLIFPSVPDVGAAGE